MQVVLKSLYVLLQVITSMTTVLARRSTRPTARTHQGLTALTTLTGVTTVRQPLQKRMCTPDYALTALFNLTGVKQ